MAPKENVYDYVIITGDDENREITERDCVLAKSPKHAEKKIIADFENYTEDTEILIAPFPGQEVC